MLHSPAKERDLYDCDLWSGKLLKLLTESCFALVLLCIQAKKENSRQHFSLWANTIEFWDAPWLLAWLKSNFHSLRPAPEKVISPWNRGSYYISVWDSDRPPKRVWLLAGKNYHVVATAGCAGVTEQKACGQCWCLCQDWPGYRPCWQCSWRAPGSASHWPEPIYIKKI